MHKTTKKTDCLFIRKNLFSYQEEHLPGDEKQKFEDHLHSCTDCTRIVSEFQSVAAIMDKKKADSPNPFIETRTLQKIESALAPPLPPAVFRRILQPLLVSFSLIFAIAAGYSIGKQIDTKYALSLTRQYDIETMKSDLNIPDFTVEDDSFFTTH